MKGKGRPPKAPPWSESDGEAEGFKRADPLAMHRAIDEGELGLALRLLKDGADPNQLDEDGFTPMMGAAAQNFDGLIRALAAAGARLDDRDSSEMSALAIASERSSVEAMRALLELGADAQLDQEDWASPLGRAKMRGGERALALLRAHQERLEVEAATGAARAPSMAKRV